MIEHVCLMMLGYQEMFLFNAAVMGFNMGINWMVAVLDQFENMVLMLDCIC